MIGEIFRQKLMWTKLKAITTTNPIPNLIICGSAHGCKLPSAIEYKIKKPKFDTEKTSNKTGQFKNSSLESPVGGFRYDFFLVITFVFRKVD